MIMSLIKKQYQIASMFLLNQIKNEPPNSSSLKKKKVQYLIYKGEEMRLAENICMAKLYLEKAKELNSDLGDGHNEAVILECLSFCFFLSAEYEKAITSANDAIAAFKRLSGKERLSGEGNVLQHIGTIYNILGKYDQSLRYHEEGLQMLLSLKSEYPFDDINEAFLGVAYGNMGELYNKLRKPEKALEFCLEAFKISKKTRNKFEEASSLHNMGNAYLAMGKLMETTKYIEESARIFAEIDHKKGLFNSHGVLGWTYSCLGKNDIAKRYFESCININRNVNQLTDVAILYGNKGECELKIAKSQLLCSSDAKESLELCIESFKLAIEESDKILSRLSDDSNKTSFTDKFYRWYDCIANPLVLSGRSTAALLFLDLGRAKILRHLVYQRVKNQLEGQGNSSFTSSWETIENGKEKERMCSLAREVELSEANATVLFYNFNRAEIFTIWLLDDNGCVSLKTSDPIDINFKTSHEELEDNIKTVLERASVRFPRAYSFFEESKVIDFQGLNAKESTPRQIFNEEKVGDATIPDGKKKKTKEDKNEFRVPAKRADESCNDLTKKTRSQLYKALIEPVKSSIKGTKLIIVPQKCLFFAPFSSFIDENGCLLSEKYQIQIIPSVHVLASSIEASSCKQIGGSLFVGNPKCANALLPPLPSAAEEVDYLSSLLDAKPLTEHMATRSKVMDLMSDASIIHIAAHGHEESGHIFLAPESVKPNDGASSISLSDLLTQSDVLKCKLSARLVVLSCCHSGKGKLSSEGVLGIARSFLGAGASSVLVTLWAINDDFTKKFMKAFYEKILEEKSACLALKESMNKFQRSSQYCSFLYWAAFEILGEDVSFTKSDIEEIRRKNRDM